MKFKIGIDGGGTKTEGILVDETGNVVAVHVGAASNPSVVGADKARSIVGAGLDSLRAQAGGLAGSSPPEISDTLLCMAGSGIFWRDYAGTLQGFGTATAADDSLPVLELATHGRPGLVLHAGTGSFVAARAPDGSVHYSGGLGWRFGDPGSAYDIAVRGIARGLLDLQGSAPGSRLARAVRDLTGFTDAATILRHFYHDVTAVEKIAPFAPHVLSLAAEGDSVAQQIVIHSAAELLDLAVRLASRLFSGSVLGEVAAGLSGPILTHPVVRSSLSSRSALQLAPVEGTPIEGVRRMLVARR